MDYRDIIKFHGHNCPGLAIGYRMSTAAMDRLKSMRADDEEIVAIVENDACGVDALQCITGCTFGKGNLLFRDYGKQVYTIYSRSSRCGVRVVFHGKNISEQLRADRQALTDWILKAPDNDILTVTEVTIPDPEPARIRKSIPCSICGEAVMETRTRVIDQQPVCIPCAIKNTCDNNSDIAASNDPLDRKSRP